MDVLRQIPAAVWAAVLPLVGVALTLRHTRKLQAVQLAHDATERDRERQMSWRREVYLCAAESISRLSSLIGRVADINASDQELSRAYQDDIAKITRIQVIAKDKTIAAVNAFTAEFSTLYLDLLVDRALLVAQRNEIESLGTTLQQANELKGRYEALLLQLDARPESHPGLRQAMTRETEINYKKAEYCSRRRQELMNTLPFKQNALLKASVETGFRLGPSITPALFAVREELEIPPDSESYLRQSNEITQRVRGAVGNSLEKIDQALAGEGGI